MPYSDPAKQRAAQAESYRRRYEDPAFQEAERERKRRHAETEEGRRQNRERQQRHRDRLR